MAWNRSSEEAKKTTVRTASRGKSTVIHGVVAGLVVAALGGAAIWFFSSGDAPVRATKERTQGRIKEVKPSISTNVVAKVVEKKPEPVETDPSKIRVKTFSVVTNSMGNIVERYQTADGKTHKWIRPSRPPVFTHSTDDIISMALAQNSGGQMPPLPLSGNMDKEFLRSIEEPIIIEPGDSEEIKERKRIVREARLEIKKLMDQGMHFNEIMADHEKVFNENAEIRAQAIAEARKIRDEGDTEGTAQYVDAMNAAFENMGIDKIDMPKTKEERHAELAAKRAAREAAKAAKENK